MWRSSFSLEELEFFASLKTHVTICPNFSGNEIYLLSGKVGPFRPNKQINVPLWLALHLKDAQKCKLYQPFWLDENSLKDFHEREKRSQTELAYLHNQQFFEISYIFMSRAPDDVPKILKIRSLVEGLENHRREKIKRVTGESQGQVMMVNLTNFEANRMREPLSKLNQLVERIKAPERAS